MAPGGRWPTALQVPQQLWPRYDASRDEIQMAEPSTSKHFLALLKKKISKMYEHIIISNFGFAELCFS